MNDDSKTLELRVGIFVLIGLIAIGIMAVQFGRVGQGLTDYYELKIVFPNASGLLKNSDVQLSGAIIGYVGGKPSIEQGQVGSVSVNIFIRDNIRIPKGSTFMVGSSGMLGDKFVEIVIPNDFNPETFNPSDPAQIYTDGETVHGTKQGGFDELTKKAEIAMTKLSDNLDALKLTMGKLHTGLLSDENLENVRESFASIKTTGENFVRASEGITEVVAGAKDAVETAKETMTSAKETMDSAKVTMATANAAANDIREAIVDARKVIQTTQTLLKTAQSGPGIVPMLLNNSELSANLRALIANMRRHGVLFYRDSAQVPGQSGRAREERQERPAPQRGPRSRPAQPAPTR